MSTQANKSKWGNFLSGAVAGLESRLDTILAADDSAAAAAARNNGKQQLDGNTKRSTTPQRTDSQRLVEEERRRSSSSSRTPGVHLSRSSTPRIQESIAPSPSQTSRSTIDQAESLNASTEPRAPRTSSDGEGLHTTESQHDNEDKASLSSLPPSRITSPELDTIRSSDKEGHRSLAKPEQSGGLDVEKISSMVELQSKLTQLEDEHESKELEWQEEIHEYQERVDTLQAKLELLAKDATEAARATATNAPKDSLDAKLAAKDERIALLLEEGQKLSKAEVAHASTARKLRVKIAEDSRLHNEMKKKLAAAEKVSNNLAMKVTRIEAAHKEATLKASRLTRLERELEELKSARVTNEATIKALRSQIEQSAKTADEDEKQRIAAALEIERRNLESLQEELTNTKIEKQLSDDRAKKELRSVQEDLVREKERNQAAESGFRNEISILEGRLEVFRVKNEEVNASSGGDSQAKLMRQVETLQSQYAVASENWQGIESSLQARVTALEKERNDATRGETDARKKMRELGSRSRKTQEQLDEVTEKCQSLELELKEQQQHAEQVQSRASAFEQSLKNAHRNFELERQTWEETTAARLEEERAKWRQQDSLPSLYEGPSQPQYQQRYRGDSPAAHRKTPALEAPGSNSFSAKRNSFNRQISGDLPVMGNERPISRRSSNFPLSSRASEHNPGLMSPNGFHDSGRSTPWSPGIVPLPIQTPSVHTVDVDDYADTASSPHRTVNDMISMTTAGAGPSVQLVERMTAAVRRLESEKAASKDEMSRLSTQRDEARREIVSLMQEVEQKRMLEKKAQSLETSMLELQKRYQTTLEMLGEKSEKVDELEADVADLKNIYKELVDKTLK